MINNNQGITPMKASEIIKQSCCGNFLSVEKSKLIDMVKNLEDQVVLLEN